MIVSNDHNGHVEGMKFVIDDIETEDVYLAKLPKSIRKFVLYEAISDASARLLYESLQAGQSEKDLLTHIKKTLKLWSKHTYGKDYPL